MANFSDVEKDLITAEGTSLSNNANDYGGLTKFGISQRQYPKVDVRNLTLDGALDIYERDYWNPYFLTEITNQKIANKLFLALINLNPHEAILCIQKAVNFCDPAADLANDGDIGTQTIEAINAVESPGWLHDRFAIELVLLYISKVEADKSQINFLSSWDSRAVAD